MTHPGRGHLPGAPARARLGRARRPLHQHRAGHGGHAAAQAVDRRRGSRCWRPWSAPATASRTAREHACDAAGTSPRAWPVTGPGGCRAWTRLAQGPPGRSSTPCVVFGLARLVKVRLAVLYSVVVFGVAACSWPASTSACPARSPSSRSPSSSWCSSRARIADLLRVRQRVRPLRAGRGHRHRVGGRQRLQGVREGGQPAGARAVPALLLRGARRPVPGLSLVVGWVLADRALRPIGRITRVAQEIQATPTCPAASTSPGPPDEMKDLADTFDGMLDRLEAAFENQRQFIHEASHELRNPIAVIRTNVDVALADPDGAARRSCGTRCRWWAGPPSAWASWSTTCSPTPGGSRRPPGDRSSTSADAGPGDRRRVRGRRPRPASSRLGRPTPGRACSPRVTRRPQAGPGQPAGQRRAAGPRRVGRVTVAGGRDGRAASGWPCATRARASPPRTRTGCSSASGGATAQRSRSEARSGPRAHDRAPDRPGPRRLGGPRVGARRRVPRSRSGCRRSARRRRCPSRRPQHRPRRRRTPGMSVDRAVRSAGPAGVRPSRPA